MPSQPFLVQGQRLEALQRAITQLQRGATSATFEGGTFTGASLPGLYTLAERLNVKAGIEAILQGAQSWTLDGTTYTRGDLKTLNDMDRAFDARAARSASSGIGVRYLRPA